MTSWSFASSLDAGKRRRGHRIFAEDGRSIVVALDHAGFEGHGPPNADGLGAIASGKPDGVLTNWHLARSTADVLAGTGLVLRVDGGISALGDRAASDVTGLLHLAEAAAALGADAVAVMAYPGTPDEHVSLRRLAELCVEAERLGLLVMAEVVPGGFGQTVAWSTENIARGARIAAELGADIVKTLAPSQPAEMEVVVQACPAPVLALGGPKMESEDDVVDLATAVCAAGAAGIIFGRNIWGSSDPAGLLKRLHGVVHGGG
jgi:class I fructose-bisphosphate aldolase/fructose-bisphosphate aldolase/2-amino-3,7-dideoxy-D-threo-hept-6-ulosonate synthase